MVSTEFGRIVLVCATSLLLQACEQQKQAAPPAEEAAAVTQSAAPAIAATLTEIRPGQDYHSYSNPDQIRVTHVALDLDADFERKLLKGSAVLTSVRVNPDATELVLDTRELEIQDVGISDDDGKWRQTYFRVEAPDPNLGAPLVIELPQHYGAEAQVRVRYRTSPQATGLQWLGPAQTAGKRHPFLFTQSQPTHARSWIPLQDSPGVRVSYEAIIRTPAELLAVMSAANDPQTDRDGEYEFQMPQPIPAYLIALGIGDLQFRAMGKRTGVYAEPELVVAAAEEFADTERMLEITENMYGPYRWGRYDLLILPPSFPFGGMENPRLSFITPTVIAGDRSLVSLIAHELAHSWSGNLVTNATWRDLWLNEGFTSYLESRIMEQVYSVRRARMEDTLSYQGILDEIAELPDESEILAIDLRGKDPDDVFSGIPYTKGQLFLVWLEQQFGRERFDAFLNGYFDHFAFQSITTEQFLGYLQQALLDADPGIVSTSQIKEWIFRPGLPDTLIAPESDAFEIIATTREAWLSGQINAEQIDASEWTVHEWLAFLNNLPEKLTPQQLAVLDQVFSLTDSANNEIAHSWLKIAIRNQYQPAYKRLEQYLVLIGRRKLIRPLYEELVKTEQGKQFAQRVYQNARPGYHPLAQRTIDGIVNPES